MKSSSSKRKRNQSDTSEDWATFSLNLHLNNEIPGTVAKKSHCKGKERWSKRNQIGWKNAARTLRRKLPKTAWPSLYWTQNPIKCPKIRKRIWIQHPFQLPHEWLAVYMADPRVWATSQPAEGSTVANALKKICLRLATDQPMNGWLNDLHMALGFDGDGAPVQGTMRQESLYFLTMTMPGCKTHAALGILFTVFQGKFHYEYK